LIVLIKDLILKSKCKDSAITKLAFIEYFDLPLIISERLFFILNDKSKGDTISFKDFFLNVEKNFQPKIDNMLKLAFEMLYILKQL
jgi:hypothetical protein